MFDSPITDIQHKLDVTLAEIKKTNDPEHKHQLLKEMRVLMADLNRLVLGQDGLKKS